MSPVTPIRLPARRINHTSFARFGQVISARGLQGKPVNEGRGQRLDVGAELTHHTGAARPALAIYQLAASSWPVAVRALERHRLSAQMFLPLAGASYLVVAAESLPDGAPDPASAAAFIACQGEGIVYAPGVWHFPLAALERPAEFAMLMWESGTPADCETRELDISLSVEAVVGCA